MRSTCHFRRLVLALSLLVTAAAPVLAQQPPAAAAALGAGDEKLVAVMHSISSHPLLGYVAELASPKYQGRLTGTPGYDAAAKWATALLSSWKIQPAGDQGSYLQHF